MSLRVSARLYQMTARYVHTLPRAAHTCLATSKTPATLPQLINEWNGKTDITDKIRECYLQHQQGNAKDYMAGSDLHEMLRCYGYAPEKMILSVKALLGCGSHVNRLNQWYETPLDYAERLYDEKARKTCTQLLRMHGAVHGFGAASPKRRFYIVTIPATLLWVEATKFYSVLKRGLRLMIHNPQQPQ